MAQKQCKKCLEFKDLKQFYLDTHSDFLRSSCKSCDKKYQTEYQKKNKETVYKRMTKLRITKKLKAVELKGNQCFDCKHTFPLCVYDFHHLNEKTKERDPAQLYSHSWSIIQEELEKCILLCANCHRLRHFNGTT